MIYYDLPYQFKILSQIVLIILLVIQIYLLMSFVFEMKRKVSLPNCIFGVFVNTMLLLFLLSEYQYLVSNMEPSALIKFAMNMPVWLFVVFLIFVLILFLTNIYQFTKCQKNDITDNSIKEGTDDLPMGVCFSKQDGIPLLVNRKMYMLSLEITGTSLQNVNHFWEKIVVGDLPDGITRLNDENSPILIFENGEVWTFSKTNIKVDREDIVQLFAVDTTDLYNLSTELKEKNESLKKMNLRLQEYSENVTELMREEEILATKVKIHADMGSAILATKYYLNNPKRKGQAEELIKTWNYNVDLLYNEASTENREDVFMHLTSAAEAVGVHIIVTGKLPKNNVRVERLIVAAGRECLTNTVRHGDGDKVFIDIREMGDYYQVEYTNNGTVPEQTVREGGGLLGLRRRVEDIGGTMKIISSPQFMLLLNIPKERR